MKQNKKVWDLIETFRKSVYFSDVLRQTYRTLHAHRYLPKLAGIRNDVQFIEGIKLLLEDTTMLKPKTILPIIENNPVEQIRSAVVSSLDDKASPEGIYSRLYGLSRAGPFFVSTLLAILTNGNHIIYEKTLLEGLKEIAPEISEGMKEVDDAESYFNFMNICTSMALCEKSPPVTLQEVQTSYVVKDHLDQHLSSLFLESS